MRRKRAPLGWSTDRDVQTSPRYPASFRSCDNGHPWSSLRGVELNDDERDLILGGLFELRSPTPRTTTGASDARPSPGRWAATRTRSSSAARSGPPTRIDAARDFENGHRAGG